MAKDKDKKKKGKQKREKTKPQEAAVMEVGRTTAGPSR